jgi:uncharacterized protein YggT (Ycf19 family)
MDNKLEIEEDRRAIQHEDVKAVIESDVNAELAAKADRSTPADSARLSNLAQDFRAKAVDEVVETERETERARTMARISQVVDYVFYVIYALFAIRLILALMAAKSDAGFVQFIKTVTDPLYAPFRGIVPSPSTAEGFTLALPIVLALVVYILLHLGIIGLLRMLAHRKTEI